MVPFFVIELVVWVFALRDLTLFQSNRRERRFGLKQAIRLVDGCVIRQNLSGHALTYLGKPRCYVPISFWQRHAGS
jgi:hypothetical protein